MKKSYKDYEVNTVEIYNPLQGCVYTLDLSDWDKEDEYLSYLYEIRVRQITRNISPIIINTDIDYPIEYGTVIEDPNNILDHDTSKKDYIFALQKIYGDGYIEYLEYMKKNSDKKYNSLIKTIESYSHKRYMVVDTETIGFPVFGKFGSFPHYSESNKYESANTVPDCS